MQICRITVFLIPLICLACESAEERIKRTTAAAADSHAAATDTQPDGMAIFRRNCVVCHGADGKLGLNGAKDLSLSPRPLAERIEIITHGKNLMTPFGAILSKTEIEAVATYSLSLNPANARPESPPAR